nr:(Fe-S)-binding protein [Candidatus Methanofastidiosa archaeon]
MEKKLHIERYRDDIYTCIRSRCGFCFSNCPLFLSTGLETYTSRGKSMIMKAFLEEKVDLSKELAERFGQCTNCGFCTTNCDVDRPDIFNAFKADLIQSGHIIEKHESICKLVMECDNPYGVGDDGSIPQKFAKKSRHGSKVLLYDGCTARYRERRILHAMMDIMDEFSLLERPVCCGSVLLRTGNLDDARQQALRLGEILNRYETVVTPCAGCYNMFVEQYPKMEIDIRPEILHSTQYIARLLETGKLHLSKIGTDIKATYHDPCHIGRRIGIFEEPRVIIKAMGFELAEMGRNRKDALCCGAGGGYKSLSNEKASNIARIRAEEAMSTGAELLIT